MDEQKFLRLIGVAGLALMIAALPWGNLAYGNAGPEGATWYANSPDGKTIFRRRHHWNGHPEICRLAARAGAANANNLGQYIPVAMPIANPLFPTDNYYEIGIQEYTRQVHSDLFKPTKFRGYIDLNPCGEPLGGQSAISGTRDRGPARARRCGSSSPTSSPTGVLSSSRWTPPSWGPGWGPFREELFTPRTAPPSITMGPLRPGSVMGRRTNGLPPTEKWATTSRA